MLQSKNVAKLVRCDRTQVVRLLAIYAVVRPGERLGVEVHIAVDDTPSPVSVLLVGHIGDPCRVHVESALAPQARDELHRHAPISGRG